MLHEFVSPLGDIFSAEENPKSAARIRAAIEKNGGHCPCVIQKSDDTICPCLEFRSSQRCICGLYVNISQEIPQF